jgi:hypothetical protein
MKYAVNLIDSGTIVFNLGEQMNTLTSPLMVFLDALLYVLFIDITLSLKILSILSLFLSVALILKRFKNKNYSQLVILSIVILSPCVLLWAVGGLDTMCTLFFATILILLVYKENQISDRALFAACFLAGLLFLSRYDSILFTMPLVLHSFVKSVNIKKSTIAVIIGSIIPLSWVIGAYIYYGDIFPTSLYVKTPKYDLQTIIFNTWYISQYLFFITAIPFILLLFLSVKSRKKLIHTFKDQFFQYWGLYMGIFFFLIYGLTVADTTHMMFSFRYFVPYIPAFSIIIANFYAQYDEDINYKQFVSAVVVIIIFQIFQAFYTYQFSINGIVLNGEFRNLGIKTHNNGEKILKETALDIKEHWNRLAISKVRPPRICTPAEGILPFNYREAYIYGPLVSYRHYCSPFDYGIFNYYNNLDTHADYIIFVTSNEEVKKITKTYTIKSVGMPGVKENLIVMFNPKPYDNILPKKINMPCEAVKK